MELQMRVRNHETNETGTTCPDLPGIIACNAPGEVAVVYDHRTAFESTPESDLEYLGPENAAPDIKKCGAGKGADCCVFLTVGPNGFNCERYSSLRWTLIFKEGMNAQREPSEPFPNCMNQ